MPILGSFGAGSGRGFGQQGAAFKPMTATGGTITEVGDYKVHTFTSPGTFEVTEASNDPTGNEVEYLIVGGGGGMGFGYGGAGGAGGYRAAGCGPAPLQGSNVPTPVTSYPVSIGAGGAGGPVMPVGPYSPASNGTPSSAIGLTGAGGGFGASTPGSATGGPGGSGGGAGGPGSLSGFVAGGTGNTPPVSPPQGNNGESGPTPEGNQGGGAGAAGASPRTGVTGVTNSIDGTSRKYACGGRSGQGTPDSISPRANSGFGGTCQGVAGCSGIVIIRYRIA